jgi:hypothetical protein
MLYVPFLFGLYSRSSKFYQVYCSPMADVTLHYCKVEHILLSYIKRLGYLFRWPSSIVSSPVYQNP